jgi:MerR family transcriptional regulator, thiopeptide resistance regulator
MAYRVHEFAELAGVTVKALRHYDRLGLLEPARTASGHRVYADKDVERLEQIVALKFLGLSLRQIRQVVERDAVPLGDALRLQRQVLEDQRRRLDRAIGAIKNVEQGIEAGAPSNAAILKQLIEVIDMDDTVDVMKKYYSDEAWARWKSHYEQEPSPELQALLADARALVGTDPGSEAAQALFRRWTDYWMRATQRDQDILGGMMRAWHDRANWPESLRTRMLTADIERSMQFFGEVAWERMATSCEQSSSRFTFPHRAAESRIAFYRDAEAALDQDARGERAREVARRWHALLDAEAAGDPDIKASLVRAWQSRGHWPPFMRQWVAGVYMMSEQRWMAVSAFLERAAAL